jgi:hypothetical protein
LNRPFDELALLSEPSFSFRASWENARAAGRRLLRTVLSWRPHSGRKDQMTACIRRRAFITLLGAAAWPLAVSAQQRERIRRIGVLLPAFSDDPVWQARLGAFLQGLAILGWGIGQNLRIETRGATLNTPDIRRHSAELAAARRMFSRLTRSASRPFFVTYLMMSPLVSSAISMHSSRSRCT